MIAPPSPVIPALVLPRQRQRKLKEVKPAISVKNNEDVDINIEDVEAREAAIRYHEVRAKHERRCISHSRPCSPCIQLLVYLI
jgi:hypothetical protein